MNSPRTQAAATFTASPAAPRLAALALAALMTLGVLAGLHTLAGTESAAQQEMAQSAASAPRS